MFGGQEDGRGQVGIGCGGDGFAGGRIADGEVAEGPVGGGEATADAGFGAGLVLADAAALVLLSADGLDGVDVAMADGGLADGVRGAGQVDLGAGLFDEGDDLVGEGRVAAEAVGVYGEEDVEGVVGAILAELAVGGDGGFGVVPEDEVAGVAGDGVDVDDVAVEGGGEFAAGGFLLLEGGFVGGGLGFGGDGAPDGDAEGSLGVWGCGGIWVWGCGGVGGHGFCFS